jgi:hypothetical protein
MVMKAFVIVVGSLLMTGACSSYAVRCSGRLQPVNAPARAVKSGTTPVSSGRGSAGVVTGFPLSDSNDSAQPSPSAIGTAPAPIAGVP